jgi:AraC family transcriptional regulator
MADRKKRQDQPGEARLDFLSNPASMTPFGRVQPALAFAARRMDRASPLDALAAQAGLSAFHLHRLFVGVAGETPKQYTLRLRVCRGAALLLTTSDTVLDIALACGFDSHETFTRAFRRQFGLSPRAYRRRGFVLPVTPAAARRHVMLVRDVAPCVGLFHMRPGVTTTGVVMSYSIETQELAPQRAVVVRHRVPRSGIAAAIGSSLPHVFLYAQAHGYALADKPFTRYVEAGAGLLTIEPGMQVVGSGSPIAADMAWPATGDAQVIEVTLPGGTAATTVHAGPYDTLSDAYAAIETWIEANGYASAGAPWECYITDPDEHPDPKDWKTADYWPVSRK